MKEENSKYDPDMLDEYDFRDGERGKYAARCASHNVAGGKILYNFLCTLEIPNTLCSTGSL